MGEVLKLSDHRKPHPTADPLVLPMTFIAAYLLVTVALCEVFVSLHIKANSDG